MKNSAKFFQNRECEHFPCHGNVPEEIFNCLFCYCPLYCLGENCGGTYHYLENGVKDCSHCTIVHIGETGHFNIESNFHKIANIAKKVDP